MKPSMLAVPPPVGTADATCLGGWAALRGVSRGEPTDPGIRGKRWGVPTLAGPGR